MGKIFTIACPGCHVVGQFPAGETFVCKNPCLNCKRIISGGIEDGIASFQVEDTLRPETFGVPRMQPVLDTLRTLEQIERVGQEFVRATTTRVPTDAGQVEKLVLGQPTNFTFGGTVVHTPTGNLPLEDWVKGKDQTPENVAAADAELTRRIQDRVNERERRTLVGEVLSGVVQNAAERQLTSDAVKEQIEQYQWGLSDFLKKHGIGPDLSRMSPKEYLMGLGYTEAEVQSVLAGVATRTPFEKAWAELPPLNPRDLAFYNPVMRSVTLRPEDLEADQPTIVQVPDAPTG